jgi:hypothetical protein
LPFIEGGRERRRGGGATMLGWPAIKAMKAAAVAVREEGETEGR